MAEEFTKHEHATYHLVEERETRVDDELELYDTGVKKQAEKAKAKELEHLQKRAAGIGMKVVPK